MKTLKDIQEDIDATCKHISMYLKYKTRHTYVQQILLSAMRVLMAAKHSVETAEFHEYMEQMNRKEEK